MVLHIKLLQKPELDAQLEQKGLDMLGCHNRRKNYRILLSVAEVVKHEPLLKEMLKLAYNRRTSA
jgi:hypothetical protein